MVIFAAVLAALSAEYSISNTKFINMTSSTYGGSIFINNTSQSLSLYRCFFSGSKSTVSGGAIYAFIASLSCKYCCATQSCSLVCLTFLINSSSTVIINQTSVSNSYGLNTSASYNGQIAAMNVSLNAVNFTRNYSPGYASISNAHCKSSFSSIYFNADGNSDGGGAMIDLHENGNPYLTSFSNFINNRPGSSVSFIWLDQTITNVAFSNCSFHNNTCTTYVNRGSTNAYFPAFIYCLFDIDSSSLSANGTEGCQFDLSSVSLNPTMIFDISECPQIVMTSFFTSQINQCVKPIITICFMSLLD